MTVRNNASALAVALVASGIAAPQIEAEQPKRRVRRVKVDGKGKVTVEALPAFKTAKVPTDTDIRAKAERKDAAARKHALTVMPLVAFVAETAKAHFVGTIKAAFVGMPTEGDAFDAHLKLVRHRAMIGLVAHRITVPGIKRPTEADLMHRAEEVLSFSVRPDTDAKDRPDGAEYVRKSGKTVRSTDDHKAYGAAAQSWGRYKDAAGITATANAQGRPKGSGAGKSTAPKTEAEKSPGEKIADATALPKLAPALPTFADILLRLTATATMSQQLLNKNTKQMTGAHPIPDAAAIVRNAVTAFARAMTSAKALMDAVDAANK